MKKILFVVIILGLILSACVPGNGNKFQVTCYQQGVKISDGVYKRVSSYWYDLNNKLVYFPSDGCIYTEK